MKIYPERSLEVGQSMRNDCTCGHCRLAHVKRESNTARVYKIQLPATKTKNSKTPVKKTAAKLVSGYQNLPQKGNSFKRKSKTKPIHKSLVQSQPKYDAWYFSEADLHTIAHSNMESFFSRFIPDLQEVGTQTSACAIVNGKTPEDKSLLELPDKEMKHSFNRQHKDRGDSPTPVALSALMNYKRASGDFNAPHLPTQNFNHAKKINTKPKVNASQENAILPKHQPNSHKLKPPEFLEISNAKPKDQTTKEHNSLHMTDLDDFTPLSTKRFHSKSKNRIKHLLESDRYSQLVDNEVNDKLNRKKHDKILNKIENRTKLPRKLLETSLRKEKAARKSLTVENEDLKKCISQAEQKVKDMRSSLIELSNTIRTYKAKSYLPCVARIEKLEKLVDDMIKEFRSSTKVKTSEIENPTSNLKDIQANYAVISTGEEATKINKKLYGETVREEKMNWSVSSIGSGIASSASTSLTALKKELGKFFEDMREDTEKLIEEAQLHHEALLSFSDHMSSSPSYDSTSISTLVG